MIFRYLRAALCVLCAAALPAPAAPASVDPSRYLEDVKFLASPELRGRATGSPELEKAAHFIATQFHSFGLKPVDGKSYFQAFSVTTNARLGTANRFEYSLDGKSTALKFQEDFIPFNFSARAKLAGEVVFAGYGITAPEYGYDDYAGIDVKGKIVLLLRHEPQEFDEKSVFEGKVYTEHAQFFSKATNAKNHGAIGVILINDRAAHRGDADELEKFGAAAGPADTGIPYAQIKADAAEAWITAAGKNLDDIQQEIDRDLHPRSFAFSSSLQIHANLDVERAVRTVHNVAGYLAGQTDEYVVIGAHYDHLGLGEQYSMSPSQIGTIHPGADDNASGTAGVIELARWYSTQPKQKRGVLFLAFAGEELGLLGSSYYASHPRFPLEKAVAMINMDMIGRPRDGKVYIGGIGSGSNLKATVEEVLPKHHLNIDFSDSTGYGSSDHTSFTAKQVPVLFFFSGLHSDYHRPSDTWDKIDAADAVKLLALVSDITDHLRDESVRPQFVRVNEPSGPHGGGSSSAAAGSGYGPYFGSIPDFTELPNGVRFADVREGSPAGKAGLKGGDVMVEFDGKKIKNLYDFTYALRAKKPGDEVMVKVLRGKDPLEVKVLLEARK
jgi:aminopeptidase YwaD